MNKLPSPLALLLLAALGVAGCQRALTLPGPGGVDGPPALAALLVRHAGAVTSLQGKARVQATLEGRGGSAQEIVVAEAPDHLRLETLGLFGQPALVFAAHPEAVVLFVAKEGRLYYGPGVARRLAFLPRGLTMEDLVAALLGRVPRAALEGAAAGALTVLPRERRYRLDVPDPTGGEGWRIWAAAEGGYPVAVAKLGPDGEPRVTVTFGDFRSTPTGPFPYRIEVVEPARALRARIEYEEIDLNPALPPGAFRLATPRGAVPVEVD